MNPRRLRALLTLSAAAWLSACAPGALERQDPSSLPPLPEPGAESLLPWAKVRAGDSSLAFELALPAGWRLHPRAPFHYRIAETKGTIAFDAATRRGHRPRPRFPIKMRFRAAAGRYEAVLQAFFHACQGDDARSCKGVARIYRIPIEAREGEGARTARVRLAGEPSP